MPVGATGGVVAPSAGAAVGGSCVGGIGMMLVPPRHGHDGLGAGHLHAHVQRQRRRCRACNGSDRSARHFDQSARNQQLRDQRLNGLGLINLEIIHQLLPFLRLDGYWTLADLTGVPDFFSQMTAFVRSVLPLESQGRKLPPLKTWAKVVFAVYILITVPLLIFLLVLMIRSVPR